jgi:hypothetical protein
MHHDLLTVFLPPLSPLPKPFSQLSINGVLMIWQQFFIIMKDKSASQLTACSHFSIRHLKNRIINKSLAELCHPLQWKNGGCDFERFFWDFFFVDLRSFTFVLCHLCSWLILFTDLRSLHLPTTDVLFHQKSNTCKDVELGTQINSRI